MVSYNSLFSENKTWVGAVSNPLREIPKALSRFNCRNNQLIATAYASISDDVEQLKQKYGKHRLGVILGSSTSGIASGEVAFRYFQKNKKFPEMFDYIQQEMGSCSEFLARYAGVTGLHYTISTACSSSGKAFAVADRLIKADFCDAVIVGGSDSLCELTLNGFDSLELLSSKICNPFSINRSGLNIGEGAALFILSKESSSIKLSGVGESSDGYHMTAPDPTGVGAKIAMMKSLETAKITAHEIGYINLHGTATRKNDEMESQAVHEIFGEMTPCSSTKPLTGHTLGAAGAQELGLCWLLLSEEYNFEKLLPAQIWDQKKDPTLAPINLISERSTWAKPRFMSHSFAFGGSNVSLIIERAEQ